MKDKTFRNCNSAYFQGLLITLKLPGSRFRANKFLRRKCPSTKTLQVGFFSTLHKQLKHMDFPVQSSKKSFHFCWKPLMVSRLFFQFQTKVFRHLSWKKDISNVFLYPESSKAQTWREFCPVKTGNPGWGGCDVFTASKCWEGENPTFGKKKPKVTSSESNLVASHCINLGGGFKYFSFSPLLMEDSQFDEYFSDGLKPPTSKWLFQLNQIFTWEMVGN